jgi:phage/plasmid-associated DNA primase
VLIGLFRGDPLAGLIHEGESEHTSKKHSKKKKKKKHKKKKRTHKKIKVYSGQPWPNRFNILPGYKWDGVDRSNGFEKRVFLAQNQKKQNQLNAYRWSTNDM